MKKSYLMFLLQCLTVAAMCQNQDEIPAGIEIPLVLQKEIVSELSLIGSPVYFRVDKDVYANNTLILKEGSFVMGEVTKVKKRGLFGIPGRVEITPSNEVSAISGKKIYIDAPKITKKGTNKIPVSCSVGILFLGWGGPLWFKGGKATIKEGTKIVAVTAGEFQ